MRSILRKSFTPRPHVASLATMGLVTRPSIIFPQPPQQQKRYFGGEMKHLQSEVDNLRVPWDFTMESYAEIEKIMKKFPRSRRRSGVIPLLHLAQWQNGGWIPVSAMYKIAKICECPPMDVFETVTFYAMFNRKPVGKYHVQFCITTPCMLRGCDDLIKASLERFQIKMGGTTKDGLITFGEMECMGCCVNAPMIVVSDYSNPPHFKYDFFEDLTVDSMFRIYDALKEGRPVKRGTQLKTRVLYASDPAGGKTSLIEPPRGPYCRDLDAPAAKKA